MVSDNERVLRALVKIGWHSWPSDAFGARPSWADWWPFGEYLNTVIHEMRERAGEWTW